MQRLIGRARVALETPWSVRVAALRRDLAMVFGPTPPAVHSLMAKPAQAQPTATTWLTIKEVVRETADAVMIAFEPGLAPWHAGQFLTVHVDLDGERLRRAYSLCTTDPQRPAIAIKRIADGRVSNHLVAAAAPGMRLEVRGPSGQFVLSARAPAASAEHIVLIGGGSGITPLIALAEAALERGDRVTLIYGNRSREDVIFFDRLARLSAAASTSDRLVVEHVYDLLDVARITAELAHHDAADAIYSCGPAPMMDAARAFCEAQGLRDILHEERFQSLGERRAEALPTTPQPIRITHRATTIDVLARPGATLLETGLAAGVAMPFSCTMGGCGACRVKVDGAVAHDTPNGLTPEEAASGYAFACIARPLGPCSIEVP